MAQMKVADQRRGASSPLWRQVRQLDADSRYARTGRIQHSIEGYRDGSHQKHASNFFQGPTRSGQQDKTVDRPGQKRGEQEAAGKAQPDRRKDVEHPHPGMKRVPAAQRGQHKADREQEKGEFHGRGADSSAKEPRPAPVHKPVGEKQDRLNNANKDGEPESQRFMNPSSVNKALR